jgi:hypothetical protein
METLSLPLVILYNVFFIHRLCIDPSIIITLLLGTEDENTAGEMSDLDVVPIPDELKAASSADPPLSVTVQWKASLDQENLFTLSSEFMEGSTFYIIITTSIALVIFIVFLGFTKVSAQRIAGGKKYTLLPSLSLNHK